MTKTYTKRISISPDSEMASTLARIATRDGIQVTTKATELVRLGLELEEDIALTSLVDERLKEKSKYISHETAWK